MDAIAGQGVFRLRRGRIGIYCGNVDSGVGIRCVIVAGDIGVVRLNDLLPPGLDAAVAALQDIVRQGNIIQDAGQRKRLGMIRGQADELDDMDVLKDTGTVASMSLVPGTGEWAMSWLSRKAVTSPRLEAS